MTFEEAFNIKLAQYDAVSKALREMVADKNHLNRNSVDLKRAGEELVRCCDEVFALKVVWDSVK